MLYEVITYGSMREQMHQPVEEKQPERATPIIPPPGKWDASAVKALHFSLNQGSGKKISCSTQKSKQFLQKNTSAVFLGNMMRPAGYVVWQDEVSEPPIIRAAPQGRSVVITSYSIHYTKLYE